MASADGNAAPPTDAMDSAPTLCASGCGFFGNPSTGGMCSKCYKETVTKTAAPAAAPVATATPEAVAPVAAAPEPKTAAASTQAEEKPVAPSGSSSSTSAEPADIPAPLSSGQVRPPDGDTPEEEPPKKVQANTSRCWTCNRKIGLLGFQCKCDYYFCSEHRYSDKHACEFDYKAQGKQLLTKANPTIAPSKMEAI